METPHSKILPNTTQVPNVVLDEWLARLSDVELRVLLVVIRQTLGWEADKETGRRKTEDWIAMRQFELKTGRSRRQLSSAIKVLVEEHRLIEAVDNKGKPLNTAYKRRREFGQIYYRLSLHVPALTLFDKPRVQKTHTEAPREQKLRAQNVHTTKETSITKENTLRAGLAPEKEKTATKPPKPSPHKEIVDDYFRITQRARGIRPIITAADGKMLKNTLDRGVSRETIEQAVIFFLYDPSFKIMAPTIKTILSAGVLTGIINRMRNEPEFWKRLDGYAQHAYSDRPKDVRKLDGDPEAIRKVVSGLHDLKAALAAKFSGISRAPSLAAR